MKILILGAGYSGILTAKKLEKKLKGKAQITIIDKNPFHTMLTELHEVAAGRVEEDSIKIDLKRVFAERDVNVVLDTVTSVDYSGKVVKGRQAEYEYDYLVMASGSKPTFFGVPGASENAFTLWSYDDAVKLKEHIFKMFRMAVAEPDSEKRRKLLTFYVVGAGFTGSEMAGELAEFVPFLCDRFEIGREEVRVCCADALSRVVPVLPEKLSAKVARRMEKMGIELFLNAGIVGVGPDYIECKTKEGEVERIFTNTVVWTAGVEGSNIVTEAGETLGKAGRGRIQTDEYLRSQNDKNVYVVGDNIFFIPEGSEMPVPQMVENAEASAHTVAVNLAADITGSGAHEKYSPKFHGVMVCIGGRYGVANVGSATKKVALPSFLAMFCKHFINIVYFVQVLGWNKIFSYVKHEFFTIRNCRSFVGGHFSNRTPSFLLVPLRLFLGFFWLFEGLKKVSQGWLVSPKLDEFIGGANRFYADTLGAPKAFDINTYPLSGSSGSVDAVSSASAVFTPGAETELILAELANPVLLNMNFLGFINVILLYVGELVAKVQIWFIDAMLFDFVLASDSMQMTFQFVITISEILIGLALMGGLFTFLAAAYSLALQLMFLTSTGLYMSSWWMAFAAVAVLIGGGRTFGLDYYVMPPLKRWWKKVRFARKWYLYND